MIRLAYHLSGLGEFRRSEVRVICRSEVRRTWRCCVPCASSDWGLPWGVVVLVGGDGYVGSLASAWWCP